MTGDPAEIVKQNTEQAFDYFWANYPKSNYYTTHRLWIIDKITQIVRERNVGNVLDVGCGDGRLLSMLPCQSKAGVDYSRVAVAQASQLNPSARIIVSDAANLPFACRIFDCVICAETLEHVADPVSIAAELVRVTKLGGIVLITVPNGAYDSWDGHKQFFKPADLTRLFFKHATQMLYCDEHVMIMQIMVRVRHI